MTAFNTRPHISPNDKGALLKFSETKTMTKQMQLIRSSSSEIEIAI